MKNKLFLPILCAMVMALFWQSCSKENPTVVDREVAKGLAVFSPVQIKGLQVYHGHLVDYDVQETSEGYHLLVKIDEKTIEAKLRYEPYAIQYNGHQQGLQKTEKAALFALADEMAHLILEKRGLDGDFVSLNATENTLIRVLEHWSKVPTGYRFGVLDATINIDRALGNDGIVCLKKGRYYHLTYDDANGKVYKRYKKAGYNSSASGCMGRCGDQCGWWFLPSAWALDCFEHDECYFGLSTGGGPLNPHCGDEWFEAVDDYVMGVIVGCNGN